LLNAKNFKTADSVLKITVVLTNENLDGSLKDYLRIGVRNIGKHGISEENRELIFQLSGSANPTGGNGVGLWGCKEIVSLYGGIHWIYFRPDK
jgi:signal transduction histidine kinase